MHQRRHGGPHGAKARVVKSGTEKAQVFKVQQGRTYWLPGFEAFCGGSWWDVDIVEKRDRYYLAKYLTASAEEDESWLPLHHLRLRTRKADDWDCHILKRGMDISVFSTHPDHEDLVLHPKALYDARITQLAKVAHDMKCTCRFHVKFYCITEEEGDPSKVRTLLTHSSAVREVDISKVSILQQPVNLTFEEILRSHMFEKWLPIKWGNDAYFLRETKITNGDDEEDGASEDTLHAFVATRLDKVTKGSTSLLHETDRSLASKGKAQAYVRECFDQKHKYDAGFSKVKNSVRGLKQDGSFEPGIRASDDILPDGFEELDMNFDLSDQHGARPSGVGGGGGGSKYEEIQKETDHIGADAAVDRGQLYAERLVNVRPNYLDRDGDCLDSVPKARRSVLDVEDNIKFAPQNRAKPSPELLVRGVKAVGDDFPVPLRKGQDRVLHQTGKTKVSPRKEDENRKRHRNQIIINSDDSDYDSEDVVADSVSSDESNFDSQTHLRKRTKFQGKGKQDPAVRVRLSRRADDQLRKNVPRRTKRRDETDIDRGKEDRDLEASVAEELHYGGKLPSEVKVRKVSTPKKVEKNAVGLTSEDKHPGTEKLSVSGRKRGRPKKPVTTMPKPSGKTEKKNSASPTPPKDASPKKKAALEVKNGKSPHPKVEVPPKSKGSEPKVGKNSDPKTEISAKLKASVVIDLEDDLCDVLEDDPEVNKEGTVAERRRGLRDRPRRQSIDGDKAVLHTHSSEGHEVGQADVSLTVRLRSQKIVKKKHSTAPSLSSPKHSTAEVETGGVQSFAQRPLYLDLLGENPEEETQVGNQNQVEVGARREMQPHKPGSDPDSVLDDLMTSCRQSALVLEDNQPVDLQNQSTKSSDVDCRIPDPDQRFGSVSAVDIGIERGGEVNVGDIPVVVITDSVGEALIGHSPVGGEGCKVVEEASTVLDLIDKVEESPDVQENLDDQKLEPVGGLQGCDVDVTTCIDDTADDNNEREAAQLKIIESSSNPQK